mgnify:CR=1 FL=1
MEESLKGQIASILFQAPDQSYAIARLQRENPSSLVTILGHLSNVKVGECVTVKGSWQNHSHHGKQFHVTKLSITPPSSIVGIQKYLESGMIQGIGPVYAKKIVEKFGENTLDIIENFPQKLCQIPGLGEKRLQQIIASWQEQRAIRDVMIFLQGHHISPAYAQKIYRVYKERSIEKVQEKPYDLAKDIFGIGFKMADAIALNVGFAKDSQDRLIAGLSYTLWELSSKGHTCALKSALLEEASSILEVDIAALQAPLEMAEKQGFLVMQKESDSEEVSVWVKALYQAEISIAREIKRIQNAPLRMRSIDVEKALVWVQEELAMTLADEQKIAVKACLEENVHIVTGGPGTGKSTITKAILTILSKITGQILLAAPTGRAAKRLTQITKKKAFTLHSILEIDFISGGFKRNKQNPLSADLIIVDEASMVDTELMHMLLLAVPDHARLLLIGDVDQLPSVGPGNVLKDLIDSHEITSTKLQKIFRQAAGSKIIINAHKINQGDFPDVGHYDWSDFHFYIEEDPEKIATTIESLITKTIPEKKRFHPIWDIQVLSPMKKGAIGTAALNERLQKVLNPCSKPFYHGSRVLHPGDKVMQIKNNYQKKVFNGELGEIIEINLVSKQVLVAFDQNKTIEYDFSELDELQLAYAISIHKSQGSEFPCVIVPMHSSHYPLLCRNLLYTAVTRGKRFVVLLGTKKAVAIAIHNDQVFRRKTGLKKALSEEKIAEPIYLDLFN